MAEYLIQEYDHGDFKIVIEGEPLELEPTHVEKRLAENDFGSDHRSMTVPIEIPNILEYEPIRDLPETSSLIFTLEGESSAVIVEPVLEGLANIAFQTEYSLKDR